MSMSEAQMEMYIGEGHLNALVIHTAGERGQTDTVGRVVAAMVENPGHGPGPAQEALRFEQELVINSVFAQAISAADEACDYENTSFTLSTSRSGGTGHAMELQLTCSRGEECCQAGLDAIDTSITKQIETAQSAIRIAPLQSFQYPEA